MEGQPPPLAGSPSAVKETLPNIVSITFPKQLAEFMAIKLDQNGIMVSVEVLAIRTKRIREGSHSVFVRRENHSQGS